MAKYYTKLPTNFCTNLICGPKYIHKDNDIECIVVSSCMRTILPVYGNIILHMALSMQAAELFFEQ